MDSARGRRTRVRLALATMIAGASLAPLHALACRTHPPIVDPPAGALAQSSDLVAIVRVERILPMSAEDAAFTDRALSGEFLDTPIRLPSNSAEVSLVRALKGEWPAGLQLRSGPTSCDVMLMEGRQYVVFAHAPGATENEIVPLRGTFAVIEHASSVAALAEVEHSLHLSNATTP